MLFRRKQEITHADTTVRARAKINLTLDVTGRREDGYHTVEMVCSRSRCTIPCALPPFTERKSRAASC